MKDTAFSTYYPYSAVSTDEVFFVFKQPMNFKDGLWYKESLIYYGEVVTSLRNMSQLLRNICSLYALLTFSPITRWNETQPLHILERNTR